jgi:hypothetical protein
VLYFTSMRRDGENITSGSNNKQCQKDDVPDSLAEGEEKERGGGENLFERRRSAHYNNIESTFYYCWGLTFTRTRKCEGDNKISIFAT